MVKKDYFMIIKAGLFLMVFLAFCYNADAVQKTPAFPGAEGGGKYTTGGRGGKVLYVTSLEDDPSLPKEGTFRWAVTQSGARTIIFKVSGIIELKKRLSIDNGDLTIAGQTAPGDGICIKDYEVSVSADNVIIRYMRFRLGDEITTHEPDAFWGRYRKNIIIDHCSMSWSIDECSSFYSNENFTMQWCIIAESLNHSLHGKGDHGYGGIWGGKNATFHHNLLAHHNSRNPRFNGWKRAGLSYGNPQDEERVDYRNNVIFNWGGNSAYGGESAGKYNIVNNYYKYGPATSTNARSRIVQVSRDANPPAGYNAYGSFFIEDNYVHGNTTVTQNNWASPGVVYDSGVTQSACKATEPFEYSSISEHKAIVAFDKVLAYAGASLARDVVDERYVTEVKEGKTTYKGSYTGKSGLIDSQSDVGGWPEYNSTTAPTDSDGDGIPNEWEKANGLNAYNSADAKETNEEGYTYLEVYLNSLVESITNGGLADAYRGGDDDEEDDDFIVKPLFCGDVPTNGVVPDALSSLVTDGAISTASGRTDGCTEDAGRTWRVSDVTFTLPAKSTFAVKFSANGTRHVYVTIDGNTANQERYQLSSSSCSEYSVDLDGDGSHTIRIESYNSSQDALSQCSMINLCINEKVPTSISSPQVNKGNYWISDGIVYTPNALQIEVFNINGQLVKKQANSDQIDISGLSGGIYIVKVLSESGETFIEKVAK